MRERATFIHHSVEWVIPRETITFRTFHMDGRYGRTAETDRQSTPDQMMTCTVGRVTAFRRLRAEDLAA